MVSVQRNIFPFFKKLISLIIVFEILITGLGFCGHIHSNVHEIDKIATLHNHDSNTATKNHFHAQSNDGADHCKENSCSEFHCTCLGGFIGVLIPLLLDAPIDCNSFYAPKAQTSQDIIFVFIYHPPIFIS